MSNTFSVPIDMETLTALGRASIGHHDSLTSFDRQSTSYRSSGFGFDSLTQRPYTFIGDATATSINCADPEQVDLPMNPLNHLSILDPSSQTLQPEEAVPTSYVPNEVAASVVRQSDIRRIWATELDWNRHRALITRLYEKNTLPKVMSIMENQGFKATVKMYKKHIAKWGLDKKNKEADMRAIVRMYHQRAGQGKPSDFRIRGRHVDFAEVVRYWERKGTTIDEVIARLRASPTPEAVECFTPVCSPITPPEDLATPEYILRTIRGYIAASFESGTWVKTDPQRMCYSIKDSKCIDHAVEFSELCGLAGTLFSTQRFEEAEDTLSATSAISRKMLLAEQPDTMERIFEGLDEMRSRSHPEIALRMLRQLSATTKQVLGESHPLSLFTVWLAAMPWSQVEDIISRCFDVIIDDFESLVGPMHCSTLSCRLASHGMDINLAILRTLLDKCESALGSYDHRTLNVRMELMICTWRVGKNAEANRMAEDIFALLQTTEATLASIWFQRECYKWIAKSYYALGELDQAIANLQSAINLNMTPHGSQDLSVRSWLFDLEQWYIEQGNLDAATMARSRRIRPLESTEIAERTDVGK